MQFSDAIELVGKGIDSAGVAVLVAGAAIAAIRAARNARMREPDTYRRFRQQLGRSILLGLELMVAGDIIRTADDPTFRGVIVLGGIVLIRTILSFSLEVEITGRWPWQRQPADDDA